MSIDNRLVRGLSCWLVAAVFVVGLIHLAVRLSEVQIDDAADYSFASDRQSVRRIQLAGMRGRIVDRNGIPLADNRHSVSIACQPEFFQGKTWNSTVSNIMFAVRAVGKTIGRRDAPDDVVVRKHVSQSLAMPIFVWCDISHEELAKFSEHECEFPGFSIVGSGERRYPYGTLASHVIGYVGRDRAFSEAGDEKFHFSLPELKGRAGLESYYDEYLRGVPGEEKVLVDARGFAIREWVVSESRPGPDLHLTIDVGVQRVVERELRGLQGACAVIDPRNGDVLALASAPGFDLNAFVPILKSNVYARYVNDPAKPLLNRASGGAYAPGSIFKPITALAGLTQGYPESAVHYCDGVYCMGGMKLRCASRWGHGDLDIRHALMKSCNPFFCNLAADIGTNAVVNAARSFGLGHKTGIDLGVDMAGTVPTAEWKQQAYHEKWFLADLVQMAIGQGMLLVSPLQMAMVAGAIGTGRLVSPHLNRTIVAESRALPFSKKNLDIVRDGMKMVVCGDGNGRGTGWRGGDRVAVSVSGKTGTAEIGRGDNRRKNAWFMAYAPSDKPTVAIAMIVENGDSGGGTTAPKVRNVLAHIFGERNATK